MRGGKKSIVFSSGEHGAPCVMERQVLQLEFNLAEGSVRESRRTGGCIYSWVEGDVEVPS